MLQLPATILFLIGCPGLVSVDWFRMDRAALGGIIVASSIAFNTMVITILLVVDLFSISGAVFTMALMSMATAGASILLARHQVRNSRWSE